MEQALSDVTVLDLGQVRREGGREPVLVTAGDDAAQIRRYLRPGRASYSADDVLDSLLGLSLTVA